MEMTLSQASARAMEVRRLYETLEKHHHGSAWNPQELMVGLVYDIGELGRLVMAKENRWLHPGDVPTELAGKLSECLWWLLVLAEKTGIDLPAAFPAKMDELASDLGQSVARADEQASQTS